MRLVLSALILLALVVPTLPVAEACHPSFSYTTPTSPSVTVTHDASCNHRYVAFCVSVDANPSARACVAP